MIPLYDNYIFSLKYLNIILIGEIRQQMDNIIVNEISSPTPVAGSQQSQQQPKQVNLTDLIVTDENSALNVLVQFLNVAQKKGAFNFEESSKIWECIKMFQVKK